MKDTETLGYPNLHMGDSISQVPDPPWFAKPKLPTIPKVFAVDKYGQKQELPYIRYALIDNEPMLLGTTGKNEGVYGDYLRAMPMPDLPYESKIDDSALEDLYTDYPFNWTLNLALYHLGDAGILADVHQYQSSYHKLKHMKQENTRITHVLELLMKEQEQHNTEIAAFIGEVASIRERLTAARVMSCVAPIYKQLAVEGRIPNAFYPQVFEEAIHYPPESPTQQLPLRPTNPEPPSEMSTPFIPSTPAIETTQPLTIPPKMDYATGNPQGPHHQPTPFDTDKAPTQMPTLIWDQEPRKNIAKHHRCYYCGKVRHWNSQCRTPHQKCSIKGRCIVPRQHEGYVKACSMGSHTASDQPIPDRDLKRKKKQRTLTSTSFEQEATTMPIPTNTGLPPPNSLLFSPNPPADLLALAFRASPYQTTPPPGTWGNAPWGANWEDATQRPPSPCIFEYRRGATSPIFMVDLPDTASLLTTTTPLLQFPWDTEGDVDLPELADPEPCLPDECDILGAVYHYDDDSTAPTMAMVDHFRRHNIRDLGVSD